MLKVIISCEDSALYVKLEGSNAILVTDSKDATKFTDEITNYEVDKILSKVRRSFSKSFVVSYVNSNFFGAKPRHLYKVGDFK